MLVYSMKILHSWHDFPQMFDYLCLSMKIIYYNKWYSSRYYFEGVEVKESFLSYKEEERNAKILLWVLYVIVIVYQIFYAIVLEDKSIMDKGYNIIWQSYLRSSNTVREYI